mmetsp:Transcript_113270/g.320904  ORF Transcript_113270/g.320904 Transcript_113270/m.320904 type:complete len:298 (+) Transcript_113270:241-1134(+)
MLTVSITLRRLTKSSPLVGICDSNSAVTMGPFGPTSTFSAAVSAAPWTNSIKKQANRLGLSLTQSSRKPRGKVVVWVLSESGSEVSALSVPPGSPSSSASPASMASAPCSTKVVVRVPLESGASGCPDSAWLRSLGSAPSASPACSSSASLARSPRPSSDPAALPLARSPEEVWLLALALELPAAPACPAPPPSASSDLAAPGPSGSSATVVVAREPSAPPASSASSVSSARSSSSSSDLVVSEPSWSSAAEVVARVARVASESVVLGCPGSALRACSAEASSSGAAPCPPSSCSAL